MRDALVISLLTFLVVATTTVLHLSHLVRVIVEEAESHATLIARQLYAQSSTALLRAGAITPSVALQRDRELRSLVDASVGYSPHLLYAMVADRADLVIVHSERDREGTTVAARRPLRTLMTLDPARRLIALYRTGETYEATLPMTLDGAPFASVRVGLSTSLLRRELSGAIGQSVALAGVALAGAWVVAMVLGTLALRPIRELARDVDRMRRGEAPVVAAATDRNDEVGELAAQLQLLGHELRSDRVKTLSEKAHLQHVVDFLEDGIIFFTPDRRILFYNRATEPVVGRPLEEALGRTLDELVSSAHPLRPLLDRAFADRRDVRNATLALSIDGQARELLVSVFFVADVERAMGAMVLLRDLESIKTLQSLIGYSAKLAALGRLTSGVAHEVKNPLNAMMIHLELVKQNLDAPPADVQESLDVIGGEIRRLDRIVQGFLRFVRPQELSLKAVDLGALLQSTAALLEGEGRKAGVRFAFALDAGCPAISGDEELLRQTFLNVLLNACQAMPKGGTVTITTEWRRPDAVTVSIADEGVGIETENRERIFSLYYTTKPEGNGIGLSIVYRIVQMHDGMIDVRSEVGRGTTMTMRFPLRV